MQNEDIALQLYEELLPYAKYLAACNFMGGGDVLTSQDDVVGELLIELVKCVNHYTDKPYIELVKICKDMMHKRIGELKYKYYLTHRGLSKTNQSLDYEYENGDDDTTLHEMVDDGTPYLEDQLVSLEFWNMLLESLSFTANSVANVLWQPSSRLMKIVQLAEARAEFVNKEGCKKIQIKPRHVADALFLDEEQVMVSYEEICDVIQRLYDSGV